MYYVTTMCYQSIGDIPEYDSISNILINYIISAKVSEAAGNHLETMMKK